MLKRGERRRAVGGDRIIIAWSCGRRDVGLFLEV